MDAIPLFTRRERKPSSGSLFLRLLFFSRMAKRGHVPAREYASRVHKGRRHHGSPHVTFYTHLVSTQSGKWVLGETGRVLLTHTLSIGQPVPVSKADWCVTKNVIFDINTLATMPFTTPSTASASRSWTSDGCNRSARPGPQSGTGPTTWRRYNQVPQVGRHPHRCTRKTMFQKRPRPV